MTIYRWLIVALWLALISWWVISAVGAKRSLGSRQTWNEIGLRLIVVTLVLIVLAVPPVRHALHDLQAYQTLRELQAYQTQSVALGIVGVVLCVAGVGVAILARLYLGRNWGLPVSRKENPELVTNGPYGYVRHPIYSGILQLSLAAHGYMEAQTADSWKAREFYEQSPAETCSFWHAAAKRDHADDRGKGAVSETRYFCWG